MPQQPLTESLLPMSFPDFTAPLAPANLAVSRCPTGRGDASQRILIVGFGALGDILMATPLLAALRRSYPNAYLTWLVEHGNVQAMDANPYIDEILSWDGEHWGLLHSTRPRNWVKNCFGLRWLRDTVRLRWELRRRHFDIFLSFHPEQMPVLLSAAAPDMAVGVFQSPGSANRDEAAHYSHAYTFRDLPAHQTDISLLPLQALGLPPATDKRMVMGYTAADGAAVDRLLWKWGVAPGFVVLAPKTTWPSKCWPEECWSALGDALASEGRPVVLIGSGSEGEAIGRIASEMQSPPVMLAGALSFREAAALIARASLCISGDTGPMHAAAAVGTPCVSLFGPTPPSRYAPLDGPGLTLLHPVPCSPCMAHHCPNPPETWMQCLRLLTLSEVRAAALFTLSSQSPQVITNRLA